METTVMMNLTSQQKRALKARAHHLKPVVRIGQKGITDSLLAETEQALEAHELIKMHVAIDDRNTRHAMAESVAEKTGATVVAHIGKISILYRPKDECR